MNTPATAHPGRWWIAVASLLIAVPALARDDEPKPDSPLVRLLKGSKSSAERQGRIIDQIGKRGTADDLGFLFREAIKPEGFPLENRVKALDAMTEAASTRNEKPGGVLDSLGALIGPKFDSPTRVSAARLAGIWKVAEMVGILRDVATRPDSPDALKSASIESIAEIGGEPGRGAIEGLAADKSPKVRALAIAAFARFDEKEAAKRAAAALKEAKDPGVVEPLMAAFLNRQGGADTLAGAIEAQGLAADPAKLALRSLYALGRSDAALAAALTKAAGLDAEPKAPDAAEMERLMAEVASKGSAARGESIFRRADLNCTKCHALAAAGGGVGPDLSSVGQSSPVDYIVNSIMVPDQAIKEVYQTQILLTTDGRIFQGIVADKDASKVVLREANGDLRTIPAAEVEASKEGGSLMPKGLVNFMTRGEFVDLVRFLSELGKPGPYAIRSTPTIQRWRLLESAADSSVSAYARVSGDLPLDELAKPGSTLTLKGDLDVTVAGPLTFRLDSADGVAATVDEKPIEMARSSFDVDLSAGHHVLTLKIDRSKRPGATVRVEIVKPEGSAAEYAIVGGR